MVMEDIWQTGKMVLHKYSLLKKQVLLVIVALFNSKGTIASIIVWSRPLFPILS